MSLNAGARLGPYEILAPLGAGGMGEVYKARDTRLERTVAIKILPPQFAADPQFRERFEREAKTISQLNHPHICTLHDVGEHDGTAFLVMEYVEGETLAQALARSEDRALQDHGGGVSDSGRGRPSGRPLPLDKALRIAIEIAGALDAAHRAGVVHRDLKPGNVMVTKAGAKLLDFGLAKSTSSPVGAGLQTGAGLTASPTMTSPLTAQGTILGTFQYMAPEQLEGQEADARSDIWAFGCVLYEMVTGRKAFQGKSQVSLIGAILKDDPPPVSTVQATSPAALDFVVRRCLAKDPDDRWQTARDLAGQLEWIAQGGSQVAAAAASGTHAAVRGRRERPAWIAVAILSVLWAGSLIAWRLSLARPAQERDVRFEVATPEVTGQSVVNVSPDGSLLAFVARAPDPNTTVNLLWVRPLDSTVSQPLAGTEGAGQLFWSPDSRQIGFGADGKVKRIDVAGGPPQIVCDAPVFLGGTWNRDDVIVFSAGAALNRVAAVGGPAVSVTELDQNRHEISHVWPSFLPDGRHFLYWARSSDLESRAIYVGSLESLERIRVMAIDSMAVYAPPGYLLFQRGGALMAQPFDVKRFGVSGDPIRVADTVAFNSTSGRAGFGISDTGVMAYRAGDGGPTSQLAWFDRTGKSLGPVGEPGRFGVLGQIAVSPDDTKVAMARVDAKTQTYDVWVLDLSSNIPTRLTVDPSSDNDPIWSPDGRAVMFTSNRKGKNDFYQRTLGGGDDTLIFESPDNPKWVDDWSPDGRFLLYRTGNANQTVFALPMLGERKPMRLIQTPSAKDEVHFSPDGRWVAYNSNESGETEVFVATFPAFENRKQVSLRGGGVPRWRGDGKELFYMSPDGKLMSVPVKPGPIPQFGVPAMLFQTPIRAPRLDTDQYAVTGNGQRFLVLSPTEDAAPVPITVVLNWTSLLKR